MHLIGRGLFMLESLWMTFWFAVMIFFNVVGGQTFTLEQGLYDSCIRVVAMLALGHLLHHHHHKKGAHWTSMVVLYAVAAISCRGFIRYFTYYNTYVSLGGVDQTHMNLLSAVLWSSFAISMLEALWLMAYGYKMMSGMDFRFSFNLNWLFGGDEHYHHHHHKADFPEYEEGAEHDYFRSDVNSIRSTPLVGLRK